MVLIGQVEFVIDLEIPEGFAIYYQEGDAQMPSLQNGEDVELQFHIAGQQEADAIQQEQRQNSSGFLDCLKQLCTRCSCFSSEQPEQISIHKEQQLIEKVVWNNPIKMECLERKNWSLKKFFSESQIQKEFIIYKYFIAKKENSEDILINEYLLTSNQRKLNPKGLAKGYILRQENPTQIESALTTPFNIFERIIISISLLLDEIPENESIFVIPLQSEFTPQNLLSAKRLNKNDKQVWQIDLDYYVSDLQNISQLEFVFFKSLSHERKYDPNNELQSVYLNGVRNVNVILANFKNHRIQYSNNEQPFTHQLSFNQNSRDKLALEYRKQENPTEEELLQEKILKQKEQQKLQNDKKKKEESELKQMLEKLELATKKLEEASKNLLQNILTDNQKMQLDGKAKEMVVNHLKELNPHTGNIDNSQLKNYITYAAVAKKIEKSPQEVIQLETQTKETLANIEKRITSAPIQNNDKAQEADLPMVCLFKMYRNEGFKVQLDYDEASNPNKKKQSLSPISIPKNDGDISDVYLQQMLLTGQTDNMKFLSLNVPYQGLYTYQAIQNNKAIKDQFIKSFLQAAAEEYQTSKEQVQIIEISKDPYKDSIKISHKVGKRNDLDKLLKNGQKSFNKYFQHATLDLKTLIDHCKITREMFNPKHNQTWSNSMDDYRGGITFAKGGFKAQQYKLPVGYFGYGLNVEKWLVKDKLWIAQDSAPTTWIVLFHGTKSDFVKNILDKGLKSGKANFYGDWTCRITGQPIPSGELANCYFSDDVKECEVYTDNYGAGIEIKGKKYIFIFQCRVDPAHVRSPEAKACYYTVEEQYMQERVRPYRILVKEV